MQSAISILGCPCDARGRMRWSDGKGALWCKTGVGNLLVNACRFEVPTHSMCQLHPYTSQGQYIFLRETWQNWYVKLGASACHWKWLGVPSVASVPELADSRCNTSCALVCKIAFYESKGCGCAVGRPASEEFRNFAERDLAELSALPSRVTTELAWKNTVWRVLASEMVSVSLLPTCVALRKTFGFSIYFALHCLFSVFNVIFLLQFAHS